MIVREILESATADTKLNEGLPAIISAFAVAGGLLLGGWIGYQDHTLSKKWMQAYNELEQQDPAKAKQLKQLVTQYKSTNWKKATIRSMTKDRIERIITDFKNEELKESATAGATSAGNIATVTSVPGAYRKIKRDKNGVPKAPQATNPDGTAKNALNLNNNIMGGKPIKR